MKKIHRSQLLIQMAGWSARKSGGDTHNRDAEVSAGKVIGSIYSASSEGSMGGDIYYIGVCKGDTITRLAIADVTGHGEAVSEISQYVYDSLKAHM